MKVLKRDIGKWCTVAFGEDGYKEKVVHTKCIIVEVDLKDRDLEVFDFDDKHVNYAEFPQVKEIRNLAKE
jgi:hypothetical protein